ncbi:MAG: T9SS type A sorting domain-containing protein [Ignavibacteria bacterium]|nr:T9SS type A sorting domain-containing protein [Ignavibacteria bacterium]
MSYKLNQNYPNPFNPSTTISYELQKPGLVSLKVYNILGKVVVDLMNDTQEAGQHEISFNAVNLPSGTYIYKIQSGNFVQVRKMLLLK